MHAHYGGRTPLTTFLIIKSTAMGMAYLQQRCPSTCGAYTRRYCGAQWLMACLHTSCGSTFLLPHISMGSAHHCKWQLRKTFGGLSFLGSRSILLPYEECTQEFWFNMLLSRPVSDEYSKLSSPTSRVKSQPGCANTSISNLHFSDWLDFQNTPYNLCRDCE